MPKGKEYKYFDFPVANARDRKQEGGKIKQTLKKVGKQVENIISPVPRKESGKFDDPYMKGSKKKSGEEKGTALGFVGGTIASGGNPFVGLATGVAGKYLGRAKEMRDIIKAKEKREGRKLSKDEKRRVKKFTIAERKGKKTFTDNGKKIAVKRKKGKGKKK